MKNPSPHILAVLAGCLALSSSAIADPGAAGAALAPISALSVAEQLQPSPAEMEMLPVDFLDCVSQQTKARWRQLYREPAASAPPTERLRISFTLGGLMADSHLALMAGDAQQFKNINQDIRKYCSSLGLADKVTPLLMTSSKMAESQDWDALRPKLTEMTKLVEKLLYEQRDDDPAELVHLGLWLRLFDMTTTLVQADPDLKDKSLCIGSIPLLGVLISRFEKLTLATREDPAIAIIGNTLLLLEKHWSASEGRPGQEVVDMTMEKVRFLLGKLTIK